MTGTLHHLTAADRIEESLDLAQEIAQVLHAQGAWDDEEALVHYTLTRIPRGTIRASSWIHQLGALAQYRGDYDEATRQYRRALDIKERIGNQASMAAGPGGRRISRAGGGSGVGRLSSRG